VNSFKIMTIVDSCSKNATNHHDMEQKREKKVNNHDDEMMEARRFCQGHREEFQELKVR
jgi:hypothetical protein